MRNFLRTEKTVPRIISSLKNKINCDRRKLNSHIFVNSILKFQKLLINYILQYILWDFGQLLHFPMTAPTKPTYNTSKLCSCITWFTLIILQFNSVSQILVFLDSVFFPDQSGIHFYLGKIWWIRDITLYYNNTKLHIVLMSCLKNVLEKLILFWYHDVIM